MSKPIQLVGFFLDGQEFALHLSSVESVVHIVEITPLPKVPDIVSGVIDYKGHIIPVMNVRRRFHLQEREIELSDQLIIADTSTRKVALLVDHVSRVVECLQGEIVKSKTILPELPYIEGVVKLEDGMILIHNLDQFLSLEEGKELDKAMKARSAKRTPGQGKKKEKKR
jgi:purine-binding chemotaxis protein CheW